MNNTWKIDEILNYVDEKAYQTDIIGEGSTENKNQKAIHVINISKIQNNVDINTSKIQNEIINCNDEINTKNEIMQHELAQFKDNKILKDIDE